MIQNLRSSLKGRLRNTDLPISKCLFPLFEAVVNSIYAIDDRIVSEDSFESTDGKISVTLRRSSSSDLFGGKAELSTITIEDNGIGFDDNNYESFCELDSMYRANRGCKGIGRLLWLKCFSSVEIESYYKSNNGSIKNRHFAFTPEGITKLPELNTEGNGIGTKVILKDPINNFKKAISKYGQDSVAKLLFEHCLWFFLRDGSCPSIRIVDGCEVTNLSDICNSYLYGNNDNQTSFQIAGETFNILHVRLQKSESNNLISYCAGNRIVKNEKIKGVVGLYDSAIETQEGSFYYKCFVTSTYFDEHVAPDRYAFLIPDKADSNTQIEGLEQIYFDDIRDNVLTKVKEFLSPYLGENILAGKDRLTQYIDTKAPYYKPLFAGLSDEEKVVNPTSTEKSMDLYLHNKLVEKEHQLIEDGHEILKVRTGESEEDYRKRVDKYFCSAQQLKQTDLARYVLHRKYILQLLDAALQRDANGCYSKEEKVHEIIMPMRITSDDVKFQDNNLWIIDERLVFHHYLASDKTFKSMEVTDCDSNRRPDILIDNVFDNPLLVSEKDNPPFATLRIVEFKRPMRDNIEPEDSTKNPIDQCISYVEKIRQGKITTKNGRPINVSEEIPAYCYVICDLTSSMQSVCRRHDFKKTYDSLGYFGYKSELKIYFEIISFDQLLNSAKERNAAFFDKIGMAHD